MITGHSVFSKESIKPLGKVGGLSGSSFVDIENLDNLVDAYIEDDAQWIPDYIVMRTRRRDNKDKLPPTRLHSERFYTNHGTRPNNK